MISEDPFRICYHINVPHIEPDGQTAVLEFLCKQTEEGTSDPIEKVVELWIPYIVLQSWANASPGLFAEMEKRQQLAKGAALKHGRHH
jgi:hypothetical protein